MALTNLFRWTLLAVFAFSTTVLSAQVAPAQCKITPRANGKAMEVRFLGALPSHVTLKVYDAKGEIFYQETERKTETVDKLLDLSLLPYGNYTLEVAGSGAKFQEKFVVAAPVKPFDVDLQMGSDKRVTLTVIGETEQTPVVEVYNAADELIFEGPMVLDPENGQTFDLHTLRDSHVTFVVKMEGEEVHKGIRLR